MTDGNNDLSNADESYPDATDILAAADEAARVHRAKQRARRRWLTILALAVVVALVIFAIWRLFLVGPSQSTDDAYVAGDTVTVTARAAGTVIALYADDTERVLAGQPLVDLDPATPDVELAAAEAQLGAAVRSVRASFADVEVGKADVAAAETQLAKVRQDLQRRQQAAAKGAVSGEEVTHATDAVTTATSALNAARSRLQKAEAQVQGAGIRDNPAVQTAIANYRRAAIRRNDMHIVAPVTGTIAKRNVQIGQHIAAGTPLMAVVPLQRVWIDANLRETQLADIRIGQPVRITTDIYGNDVVFHGRVIGLSAGSGDAFSLLPPQNATGNWIKIVQRLPVRIALDAKELEERPLRIGLSATVRVDTADRSGAQLGSQARQPFAIQESIAPDVDSDIARIIRANSGSRH